MEILIEWYGTVVILYREGKVREGYVQMPAVHPTSKAGSNPPSDVEMPRYFCTCNLFRTQQTPKQKFLQPAICR